MLMTQPFYIGGVEDVEVAKGSAFGAAGTFFFTFLMSIYFMNQDARRLPEDSSSGTSSSNSDQRRGGSRGNYGQVPIFRDFDDPIHSMDVPENFEQGTFS